MPDPYTLGYIGINAANALINAFSESPQEKYYKWLMGELDKPWVAQGLTQAERENMRQNLRRTLERESQRRTARFEASAARRGVGRSAIVSGRRNIEGDYAEAFGQGERNILDRHLQLARQRYNALLSQAPGVVAQQPSFDIGAAGQGLLDYKFNQDYLKAFQQMNQTPGYSAKITAPEYPQAVINRPNYSGYRMLNADLALDAGRYY